MNTMALDDLVRKLVDLMPSGAAQVKDDLEQRVRAALRSRLTDLDLVTREEFEVQMQVLARTREKLERLEGKLAELEARQQPGV